MSTEVKDWFGNVIGEVPGKGENPMLIYGRTDCKYCRTCVHLQHVTHNSKTYIKCELRKLTRGAGSDHKASWPACGKYEEAQK